MTTDPPPPATAGQRRIMGCAARANRRLVAVRQADGAWAYKIIALSAQVGRPPRRVMRVAQPMAQSLVAAGWIERRAHIEGRDGWVYRVTEAGLRA
jgi:hypothetical protein